MVRNYVRMTQRGSKNGAIKARKDAAKKASVDYCIDKKTLRRYQDCKV